MSLSLNCSFWKNGPVSSRSAHLQWGHTENSTWLSGSEDTWLAGLWSSFSLMPLTPALFHWSIQESWCSLWWLQLLQMSKRVGCQERPAKSPACEQTSLARASQTHSSEVADTHEWRQASPSALSSCWLRRGQYDLRKKPWPGHLPLRG